MADIDFAAMKVGDTISLPAIEWHKNHEAKAVYAAAQEFATASSAEPKPQFQIGHGRGGGGRLISKESDNT